VEKMHDGNGLRDQCAVGNGLLDSLMHDGNGLEEKQRYRGPKCR